VGSCPDRLTSPEDDDRVENPGSQIKTY
jgi:hypothetical protein